MYTQSHSVPDKVNICLTLLTEFFHRCYTIKNKDILYIYILYILMHTFLEFFDEPPMLFNILYSKSGLW